MQLDRRGALAVYRFDSFPGERLQALVSTRLGGVSPDPYASLNLGLGTDDDPAAVVENRRRLFSACDLDLNRSVWAKQVHSDTVAAVAEEDAGRGSLDMETAVPDTDALVTDVAGLALCVTVADCAAVALYDPAVPAIGLAHAGWSGTVARIASRTVAVMRERFGSDPARLLVAIGPSIGPAHYEVGADVIAQVEDAYGPRSSELLAPRDDGRALLDLWRANSLDLEEAGLDSASIEVAGLSTAQHLDSFYSHRTEGSTGRFATVVVLR